MTFVFTVIVGPVYKRPSIDCFKTHVLGDIDVTTPENHTRGKKQANAVRLNTVNLIHIFLFCTQLDITRNETFFFFLTDETIWFKIFFNL